MVQDKNNKIYTELLQSMKVIYPALNGGTVLPDEPPKFPYMYFKQIDGATRLTTLSNTEDGINLAFQIEVYTDKGMNLARKISNSIREYMVSEGFRVRVFNPLQTGSNVSRFVGRYERLDV